MSDGYWVCIKLELKKMMWLTTVQVTLESDLENYIKVQMPFKY